MIDMSAFFILKKEDRGHMETKKNWRDIKPRLIIAAIAGTVCATIATIETILHKKDLPWLFIVAFWIMNICVYWRIYESRKK
jgi:hypothetical protein